MNKFTTAMAILAMIMFFVGCTTTVDGEKKVDPVATGEIIGFTYLITKDELSDSDREVVEKAYAIFTDVVNSKFDLNGPSLNLKSMLFAKLDEEMDKPDQEAKKAAIKLVITRIWSQVDAKYDIDIQIPTKQLAILKDVQIGIERGLGHTE
jgi:hypothetical protein